MLKVRIQILEQGGVISSDVAAFMNQVIDRLTESFPDLPQEKAEMFTTHLAMAAQRISKGDIVEMLDETMWDEVAGCAEFAKAQEFFETILAVSPVEFPESEKRFMLLHICSMLQE